MDDGSRIENGEAGQRRRVPPTEYSGLGAELQHAVTAESSNGMHFIHGSRRNKTWTL